MWVMPGTLKLEFKFGDSGDEHIIEAKVSGDGVHFHGLCGQRIFASAADVPGITVIAGIENDDRATGQLPGNIFVEHDNMIGWP